jgi:fructose-bisphosphate aldolase/2-amino-3,7-dideoxy-D-threo-hept-6-ulosonate synthase
MLGKKIRLERIMNRETQKTVIVPMDHGVTAGPIEGLINLPETVNKIAEGGANAVLGHVGLALHGHRGYGRDIGLIIHLSGSTLLAPDPHYKVLVNSVERAIKMGADAVSIHVNLGSENEAEMLKDLGKVSEECEKWGMPLLAMMYTRGPKIKNEYDVKVVKHAARVAAELGADIVKVNYTGSVETFREVVEGCFIPVVIAGGEKLETEKDLLEMVDGSLKAGGKGVSIGRNVFQHKHPDRMVRAISGMVHEGWDVEKALKYLKEKK